MIAFRVRLNGKRLCTAGIGPDGVLTAIVTWVGGGSRLPELSNFDFHVGGLDSRTREHVDYETPQLQVGDKVSVEIIEADQVDPETKRCAADPAGAG
jgi:hypothetical protein